MKRVGIIVLICIGLVISGVNSVGERVYSSLRPMSDYLDDGRFYSEDWAYGTKYTQRWSFSRDGRYNVHYEPHRIFVPGLNSESGTYSIDNNTVHCEMSALTVYTIEATLHKLGVSTHDLDSKFEIIRQLGVLQFPEGARLEHRPDSWVGAVIGWSLFGIIILLVAVVIVRATSASSRTVSNGEDSGGDDSLPRDYWRKAILGMWAIAVLALVVWLFTQSSGVD